MISIRSALTRLAFAALASIFPLSALAQTSPVPAAPAAAGPSITLPFFLLAKNEEPIAKVAKEDITVGEDTHPETIQTVVNAADQPISMAFLMDTRGSLGQMVQSARTPLQHFVDAALTRPADQAAVVDFNDDAGLDLQLSSTHDKIQKALDHLSARPAGAYAASGDDRNIGGNVLFDALFLASDEVLKDKPGRKVIIVLTDGLDRGSKESILSAIEAAQRAHALIYTIEYPSKEKNEPQQNDQTQAGQQGGGGYPGGGGGYPGGGGGYPGGGGGYPGGGGRRGGNRQPRPASPTRKDSKKVLMQLSADTGGHAYEVSSKLSLDQVLGKINDQLKAEQFVTYGLSKEDREEGFHRLQWGTKQKDQLLQAPAGFYINQP